ncbi:hypothetical protein HK101_000745 [Irineochytrium annulatum]|nr:hypothetical protein HK101_000745 [Irineochytrium annulatum]
MKVNESAPLLCQAPAQGQQPVPLVSTGVPIQVISQRSTMRPVVFVSVPGRKRSSIVRGCGYCGAWFLLLVACLIVTWFVLPWTGTLVVFVGSSSRALVTVPTRFIDQVKIIESPMPLDIYVFEETPKLTDTVVIPTRRLNFSNPVEPNTAILNLIPGGPHKPFPAPKTGKEGFFSAISAFQLHKGANIDVAFDLPEALSHPGAIKTALVVLHVPLNPLHFSKWAHPTIFEDLYSCHGAQGKIRIDVDRDGYYGVFFMTSSPFSDDSDAGSITLDASSPAYALDGAIARPCAQHRRGGGCVVFDHAAARHRKSLHVLFVAPDAPNGGAFPEGFGITAAGYEAHGRKWIYGTYRVVTWAALLILFGSMITTCCCSVSVLDLYRIVKGRVVPAAQGYVSLPTDDNA